jgi:hypothetical protein
LVNDWLERMPFFDDTSLWKDFPQSNSQHPFWIEYKNRYSNSLAEELTEALDKSKELVDAISFEGKYFRKDIGYEFVQSRAE